jgi:hypothetical protein
VGLNRYAQVREGGGDDERERERERVGRREEFGRWRRWDGGSVGWYGGWGRKVRWGRRKLLSPRRWGIAGVGRDGWGGLARAPPAARLAWQVVGLFGLSRLD